MLTDQRLRVRGAELLDRFDTNSIKQVTEVSHDDLAALTYAATVVATTLPPAGQINLVRCCIEIAFFLGWRASERKAKITGDLPNFTLPPDIKDG